MIGDTGSSPNLVFQNDATIKAVDGPARSPSAPAATSINFAVNTGFGTTSPFGRVAISLNAADAAYPGNNAFIIASSTANSTSTLFNVLNNGRVGIGTSTPDAKLSIYANVGENNATLFNIASSTGTATTTLFSVTNAGGLTFLSATGTTLSTTIASSTNIFGTFATSSWLFTSLASSTNFFATNATTSNFFANLASTSNFWAGQATTTKLFATVASTSKLFTNQATSSLFTASTVWLTGSGVPSTLTSTSRRPWHLDAIRQIRDLAQQRRILQRQQRLHHRKFDRQLHHDALLDIEQRRLQLRHDVDLHDRRQPAVCLDAGDLHHRSRRSSHVDTTAGSETVNLGYGSGGYVTADSGVFFGIGSSTPSANLTLQRNYGDVGPVFTIASSTAADGSTQSILWSMDPGGTTTASNGINLTGGLLRHVSTLRRPGSHR